MENKDWVGNKNSIFKTLGASNHTDKERQEDDFYATDPLASELLLELENFNDTIIDNSYGAGHLMKPFIEKGHKVIGYDIKNRTEGDLPQGVTFYEKDFLTVTDQIDGDFVFNPPYKCFDIDTEVFTKRGWLRYDDVKEDDEILSVNPDTLEIEWSGINFKVSYLNDSGFMYHFDHHYMDIMVTEKHRMFAFRNGKRLVNEENAIYSDNIRGIHYIPLQGYKLKHNILCNSIVIPEVKHNARSVKIRPSVEIDAEKWIPFFAMWIADGSLRWSKNIYGNNRYTVCIKQHVKTENIVEECLNLLPFKFKKQYHDDKVNFVINDIRLWHYLKTFGKSRDKFIPSWIKENSDYINLFLEWYRKGDGSVTKDGFIYRTISKQLAEDLQECLFKTGLLCRITHIDCKTCRQYSIRASENTTYSKKLFYRSNKNSVLKTPYNGKVWCLNLEKNGFMLLRRNNKPFISGNCAQKFVEHSLRLAKKGRKVCAFLKLQFLEGKSRRALFEEQPPRTVYVSSSRLLCAKNAKFDEMKAGGGSAVAYAWFVWEKGYEGPTEIRWFN